MKMFFEKLPQMNDSNGISISPLELEFQKQWSWANGINDQNFKRLGSFAQSCMETVKQPSVDFAPSFLEIAIRYFVPTRLW